MFPTTPTLQINSPKLREENMTCFYDMYILVDPVEQFSSFRLGDLAMVPTQLCHSESILKPEQSSLLLLHWFDRCGIYDMSMLQCGIYPRLPWT